MKLTVIVAAVVAALTVAIPVALVPATTADVKSVVTNQKAPAPAPKPSCDIQARRADLLTQATELFSKSGSKIVGLGLPTLNSNCSQDAILVFIETPEKKPLVAFFIWGPDSGWRMLPELFAPME